MLTTELACAYTSLSEVSFRFFARKNGVEPIECAGLAVTRWRKTELDALIDKLPARGAEMNPDEPQAPANDPASDALKRAERRARRG